ncbi:plasmid segregation protein ParM-like [Hippocampus zosterae]|uniref:plasmid segregation protein ParM-like n=1 Tax=Hippocampus zosterae TaxID=109293 RepID=UPI00223CB527|nr:plasmid segregation protein ParM-like [Hippocampus zosterae]
MTATTVIIDEGSSQVKLCWQEDDQLKTYMIKSRGSYTLESTLDGGVSDTVYNVDGVDINIDDRVSNPIDTNSDHYQTSDINRALVHHALREAGFGGKKVDLMVTLPVDTFYRNSTKRDAKKSHIQKPVTHVNGLPLATINSVMVAPEAVSVLDSIRLNDSGELLPEYEDLSKVLIVDIGGTTTDITIVTRRNTTEGHASVRIGVFDIARNLKQQLFNDPSIEAREPSMDTLDHTLRTGTFRKKDVSRHIAAACEPVKSRILSAITPLVPDPEELDFVCYVGGGANLLAEPLSRAYGGNTITHSDPEFAVAVGLMKNELSYATTE